MVGEIVSVASGSTGIKKIAQVNSVDKKRIPEIITTIFIVNLSIVSIAVLLNYSYIVNNYLALTNVVSGYLKL